jgi:hypothetical protein
VEDLAGVPVAVGGRDRAGTRLGADERMAGERYDVLAGSGAVAHETLRHQDAAPVADTEDALVEEPVVQ